MDARISKYLRVTRKLPAGGHFPWIDGVWPCPSTVGRYPPRPFPASPTATKPMSRVCESTGRRTRVGNKVARRGLAKKKGGVGRRVTGRSKRKFKPNIQRVRVLDPDGRLLRLKLSTRAIKTGMITLKRGDKTVTFPLVRALRGRNREFTKAQKPEA